MNKKIILIALGGFIAGILFCGGSYIAFKKSKPFIKKVAKKLEERRIAAIPKAKEPLTLFDFETPADTGKWSVSRAAIDLSLEHPASGASCAKITFLPSGAASSIRLDTYFEKNKALQDWSRYEVITFDIFNPSSTTERIILQIKDTNDDKIKRDLYLEPNTNNHIEVDISELWGALKPSHLNQFNLFLWDNKATKVFYLDNLRLLPSAMLEKKNINIASEEYLPKPQEKIYAIEDYFAFNDLKWKKTDPQTNTAYVAIPLMLSKNYLPSVPVNLPICGGIPLGKGQLYTIENLELVDSQGVQIPAQTKIMATWPDKSIKWLLLNSIIPVSSQEKNNYYLRYAKDIQRQTYQAKLTVEENQNEVTVNTGKLRFTISKRGFCLLNKVWLDKNSDSTYDEAESLSSQGDMVIVHKGKEYKSSLDKNYSLTIEESGPIRVCLKAQGWFVAENGKKFCQFSTRIYAFEGSSYIKVQHTFVYTGYPENKVHYLYKGKRLPENETIDAIYIKTPLNVGENKQFTFAADNKIMQAGLTENTEFLQSKFNSYTITKGANSLGSGAKLDGWIDVSTQSEGVTLGIKNFWQQYPKGWLLDKEKKNIITYIWPAQAGKLDFKTTPEALGPDSVARGSAFGVAKTHELFFYFHTGDYAASNAKDIAYSLTSDMLVTAAPQWVADTKVLGRIYPADSRFSQAEEFLSRLFDWGARQIENFGWYGMVDFGDTLSWHRDSDEDNSYDTADWHPVGRWGWFNCEAVGTHTGALMQFLRSADYKYLKFGANQARHSMDIDPCHYNTVSNDKRLKGVIPDDYSRVGSMHRHNGNHWGDRNEEASHTNLTGLLLYYYITGDERAHDVLDEMGSFFLNERLTYFRHPDMAPQRSIANVLWGEVLLYELTADERYKKAADTWAGLLYLGQKHDGAWAEDYNPVKKRWDGRPHGGYIREYTIPALIAYHQLTGNKAIAGSILKATEYVIKTEEYGAYFDGSAYCYWLTGDRRYLANLQQRLDYSINHQRKSSDPLQDGMIYQKAYYARVMEYLYKMPFALEPLTHEK